MCSCHVLVCFTQVRPYLLKFFIVLKMLTDSVILFSFHFAGIEATLAHVQIAFPFTSALTSHSASRLSLIITFINS